MIRPARPDDIPSILELGERARQESGYRFPEIDRDRIYGMAANWFFLSHMCCALVSESENQITGMLISTTAECLWSGEKYALCHTLYCLPSHRNKAPYLIKDWLRWCRAINAKKAYITLETEKNNVRLHKILEMYNFKEDGVRFAVDLHG